MPEHESTAPARRASAVIEAPPVASNLNAHIPKEDMHKVVHRIKDIQANAKASWTHYEGEDEDKKEGYSSLYRGTRRLVSFISESKHAHKVRVAERAYKDALKNMSFAHVKVELDPANPDQQPIFDLIKKAGIPDASSNPYFIMELKGKKGADGEDAEGTGTYVAYDPKLKKYVMYWQKRQLLGRFVNYFGRTEAGSAENGRFWFDDQKKYEMHLAKQAGVLASGMLTAPVEHTNERKVLGYTERFNTFDRKLIGGNMKVPEGIAIIEMDEKGKLLVQGTPYFRATAREMQRLQVANTRRLNRERAEREEAERMQRSTTVIESRFAEMHYQAIDVAPEQAAVLNEWFNVRTAAQLNLRNRNASIVYRDEAGNDIVAYSHFQDGQRLWRVGVPEAIATGFNQRTITNNMLRVPQRPATFNAFNGLTREDRPANGFTLNDPDRAGRFDDTVVQFRVSRNGGMFRMMHPDIREVQGAPEARIISDAERARLRNAEIARNTERLGLISNVELRTWMAEHDYTARRITPLHQEALTRWANTVITPDQAGRNVAISYRSGNVDLILHGNVNTDGSRTWNIFAPENIPVNETRAVQNVLRTNVENGVTGDARLPDFIAGAATGTFPPALVQISIGRKLNAAGQPVEPGVGLVVTPPTARRAVMVTPTVTPVTVRTPAAEVLAATPVVTATPDADLRDLFGVTDAAPAPLVFNELARGEAPQQVSDNMNMFYSRWIDSVLVSNGIDASRVIVEAHDPATNEEYHVYKQNMKNRAGQPVSAIGLVATDTVNQNENVLMSALPYLEDVSAENVRIVGNPQVSQDFTLVSIDTSSGTPIITIVPPAIVASAAPIAAPAGTIFAPTGTSVSAPVASTSTPVSASAAQPADDLDAFRKSLGVT